MSKDVVDKSVPYFALSIVAFLLIIGLTWVVQGNEFFLYRAFAPKMEAARREAFEESKAYNDGWAQELRRMQSEYIRATPQQRPALASVILHQADGYDETRLPRDLREFIEQLKQQGNH